MICFITTVTFQWLLGIQILVVWLRAIISKSKQMYLYVYFFFSVLRVLCSAATLAFDSCQTDSLPSSSHCFVSILRFFSKYIPNIRHWKMVSTMVFYSLQESGKAMIQMNLSESCSGEASLLPVPWISPCAKEPSSPRCCLILKWGTIEHLPSAAVSH